MSVVVNEDEVPRGSWSSRVAFIMAAMGAAIGLGNIWRFPALAYGFGGGSFLIPYVVALIFIGIPLLILELGLGQLYKSGDVVVFGRMNDRLRGVGVGSIWCGFMVVAYYCVILAWALRLFVHVFDDPCPFALKTATGAPDLETIKNWIVVDIWGYTIDPTGAWVQTPKRMIGWTVFGLAVTWASIFVCLMFGVKWTGRFTYFTMGFPIALLIALMVAGLSQEGSSDGVKSYVGTWDMKVFDERPEIWTLAVSQIFFSIGVTFGIMTAYSSYNSGKNGQSVVEDAFIISISNSFFSFLAGFAVFGTMGYLSAVSEVDLAGIPTGGLYLVMVSYPMALMTLSGGKAWCAFFFITIFLLGLDSAFSLAEGVITCARDTTGFAKAPRPLVVGVICLAGFLFGLPYCLDVGLTLLDAVDYYINYIMLFVGIFECIAVGWVFKIEEQVRQVGVRAVTCLATFSLAAPMIAVIIGFSVGGSSGTASGLPVGIVLFAAGCGLSWYLAEDCEKKAQVLFLGGAWDMSQLINTKCTVSLWRVFRVGYVWSVLVKFVIPMVLIILIGNGAAAKCASCKDPNSSMFGNYGDYPVGYQVIGIIVAMLGLAFFLVGLAAPRVYSLLAPTQKEKQSTSQIAGEPAAL